MIGAPVLEGGTPKLALHLLLSCRTDARFSTRDSLDRLQVEHSSLRRAVPPRVALITSLSGLLKGRCSTQRPVQDSRVCRSGPVRPLRMASSMPSTATLFCAAFGVLSTAVLLQMRDALSYLCSTLSAEACAAGFKKVLDPSPTAAHDTFCHRLCVSRALGHRLVTVCMCTAGI